MKKRIFIFLTLLIACFGLFSVISNNKVTYAAGDEASLEYDANAAISSVPSKAIISFPVTSESVYGNTITWSVTCNDGSITYDDDADWMVVHRDENNACTATITVTVSNNEDEPVVRTKEVTVPAGYTAAPKYQVSFDTNGGNEMDPIDYKLGDPTIDLRNYTPSFENHVFRGWYVEDTKVEKIYVGSMEDYTLTAKWDELAIESISVDTENAKVEYLGGENLDTSGLKVYAHYNDESVVPVNEGVEYSVDVINWNESGKVTVTVEYQEKTATYDVEVSQNVIDVTSVSFSGYTTNYNGESHTLSVANLGEYADLIQVSYKLNEVPCESISVIDAGTYNVSATLSVEDSNYVLNGDTELETTITINQASNQITLFTMSGWTYGDTAVEPSVQATWGNDSVQYIYYEGETKLDDVPTKAGSYKVVATVAETSNYKGAVEEVSFEISKKAITVTTSDKTIKISEFASLNWVFESTGLVGDDTIESVLGDTVTAKYYVGEEQLTPMAGNTYTVKFEGTEYDNYIVTFENSTLTISIESLYFAYTDFENIVYDGTNKMFTVKAYAENGNNDIEIKDATVTITLNDEPFTGAVDAGKYEVVVSIDSPSYGKVTETKEFVIEQASIDLSQVTFTGGTVSYNGENKAIKVVGEIDPKVEVSYNITDATNAGTYNFEVTFTSTNANYKPSVTSLTATLIIEKADNEITSLTIENWVYAEEASTPVATAVFGSPTYTYSTEKEGTYTSEVPTNAGTYYVKASVEGNDNYTSASLVKEFIIEQATIDLSHVTFTGGTVSYNGENQAIKVVGEIDPKVEVSYNITDATDVDTYEFIATFTSLNENYKLSKTSMAATLVIEQAANAISNLAISNWEYGATANAPTAKATFGTISYTYSTSEDGDYSETVPTNAGEYYVKATVEGNDNYEGATATLQFAINAKVLKQSDVVITVLGSDYNTIVSSTLTPSVKVMFGEVEITSYEELAYAYGDAETKLGQATITIAFNGNYSGTVYANFEVTEFGRAGVDAAGLPSTLDEATLASGVDMTVGSSNVFWSSSSTAVVFDAEGNVTINKAALTEDTTVTITAIVTYGETSAYKKTYEVEISAITVIPSQTDENTGIIAENANGELNVEVEENGNFTINEYNNTVKVYDIYFEGEIYNEITIKIPVPEGYENSELSVYHIVNGSPVYMDAEKIDGYLVFTSNSFSPYVVTVKLYEISFVNGTDVVKTCKVESGKLPVAPESNPIKASTAEYSYTFTGWDVNGDGTVDALAAATKNAEYKAVFTETLRSYTVTFDSNGGTEVATQTIQYGKTVSLPTEPTKENYTFVGWNLNDSPFDFSAQITGDIILVAEWEEKQEQPEQGGTESSSKIVIEDLGYENGTAIESISFTNGVTLTLSKGSNSNAPKYYDTGKALRAYGGNTLTFTGTNIVKIELTFSSGEGTNAIITSAGTFNDGVVSISGGISNVVLTIDGTSGHRRIASITVYTSGNGGSVTPEQPEEPKHVHIECSECGLCIDPNCDGIINEQCQGHSAPPENPSESQWVLVTDASTLKAGDQIIIVAKDYDFALSNVQNNNNRGQTSYEKGEEPDSSVQILTLVTGTKDNTFGLYTGETYLYAASSSSNYLKTQSTLDDNASWEITISADGTATIKAQGTNSRNWLRYNSTSSLFSCYSSGQKDICIYICE